MFDLSSYTPAAIAETDGGKTVFYTAEQVQQILAEQGGFDACDMASQAARAWRDATAVVLEAYEKEYANKISGESGIWVYGVGRVGALADVLAKLESNMALGGEK